MRTKAFSASLIMGLVLAIWGVGIAAPAAADEATTVAVCVKTGQDLRAPYKDGTCPDGYILENVATAPLDPGTVAVCIKPANDWRAPYNQGTAAGTCPSGFAKVGLAQDPAGLKACVKPSTDVRAPYKDGTCPTGFQVVFLALDEGSTEPEPPATGEFFLAAGQTATLSNTTFLGCNDMTYGYQLSGGSFTPLGSKTEGCTVPQENTTIGPFSTAVSFRIVVVDDKCGSTFDSMGNHARVTGGNPAVVDIFDGGDGCQYTTTPRTPEYRGVGEGDFSTTVTIG